MVIGTVVDVLAAMSSESRKHVCCVNVRIGQHLQNSGVVRHGRIGREFIRQYLCRHRDKDRIHRNALCCQFTLQFRQRFCVGCELLFAVSGKLVHQVLIFAEVDAAAFPFADG